MRILEIENLTEMPLGTVTRQRTDKFSTIDQRVIHNKGYERRLENAFAKTPFTIDIVFQSEIDDKGQDDVDKFAQEYSRADKKPQWNVEPKDGVITVVLLSNLSGDKSVPFTPWIIAHKIAHSIQDASPRLGQRSPKPDAQIDQAYKTIDRFIDKEIIDKIGGRRGFVTGVQNVFTFKSARTGSLNSNYEIFPELFAQYIIQGKISLQNNWTQEMDEHHWEMKFKNQPRKFEIQIEAKLNELYSQLLSTMEGGVFVAV